MAENSSNKNGNNKLDWKKTAAISGTIIIAAVIILIIIFSTEPKAERVTETKKTAMLVDVINVEYGNFRPTIVATGTVAPAQDITLSPRISGEVLKRSDNFTPGSFVEKGEVLLQIDPADYENLLKQRESELRQAKADLMIEMGRQSVAQQDYELLDEDLAEENKSLVLRKPQLETARSRVESAEAAFNQAKLDLERTKIKAPFNAQIIRRNANVGSQVAPGTNLGRLVGIDNYWVVTTIPVGKLRWLDFTGDGSNELASVKIQNRTAWDEDQYRKGYLYRLVGELADQTRLARVIINVPDPLLLKESDNNLPKLIIGEFVETRIEGKEIENTIRLNRDYVRKGNTVWVMEGDSLSIRDVDILLQDAEHAYISDGLSKDDKIVTTNLSTVVAGAKLRTEAEKEMNKSDTKKKRN